MQNWIIACNLKQYDVNGAFSEFEVIEWKQSVNFNVDDIVYIYISHPVMEVRYKCIVEEKDIVNRNQKDIKYVSEVNSYENYGKYIRLRKLVSFTIPITSSELNYYGLNGRIQGPRRIDGKVLEFIVGIETKQEQLEQEKIELLQDVQLNIDIAESLAKTSETITITYKPKPIPELITIQGKKTYPRDKQVSINALLKANFKCEFDDSHTSFISKYSNSPYMEAHHLVPLSFQDRFSYSLDVEANIISLCSHCHNLIHYGLAQSKIIIELYQKRKQLLMNSGIDVNLEDLISYYNN